MSVQNERIWITGASSGIGRQLAIELARLGNQVIASARNGDALKSLVEEQSGITALVCDITCRDDLELCGLRINQICSGLDRVIMNAGTCEYLDIDNPDWAMMERIIKINFLGAVNTVECALPLLRKSGHKPHIVGIASQATFAPFVRAEAYGASKAALQYFLDALRVDLYKEHIDVTVINPGFVKTPLTDKNDFAMPFLMSSDQACQRIIHAMEKRPYHYNFPKRLAWLLKSSSLMPKTWAKKMSTQAKHAQVSS